MQDIPPQGSIDDIFLPRLVSNLHRREFEGTLRLTLPDNMKVLYFRRGEIASAASNAEPDRLANILIREGRLTEEQLELARSRLPSGASLGKALIEMGFLSPSELLQGARQQVRVILTSCFRATSGTYEMVPGPLPAEVTSLGLNTRRLIFDALMETGDRPAIIREVGSMETAYRPTVGMSSILSSLKLDAEADRIGQLLNGKESLRDISGRTSRDDFTVSKVALALELLGGAEKLEPAEEPAPVVVQTAMVEEVPAPEPVLIPVMSEAIDSTPASAPAGDFPDPVPDEEPSIPVPAGEPSVPFLTDEPPVAISAGEQAADEPPPIPDHELPAFARPPEEPPSESPSPAAGSEPQWHFDPATGDRVHVGPIEVTFDGRIAPESGEPRNLMWILLAAGAVTLVVAGALGYVILRRGAVGPATEVATLETASAPAPPARETQKASGTATGEVLAAGAAGSTSAPAAEVPAAEAAPAPVPMETSPTPEPLAAPEIPRPSPPPPPAPRPRPESRAAGPIADPRYDAALLRLDQGDPVAAARMFEEWIDAASPRGYSLQFMIACQEETVKSARSRSGAGGALFILPYTLKGRPCYRVLWGVYGDTESARAALPGLPQALVGDTSPIVVPLSRSKSSG